MELKQYIQIIRRWFWLIVICTAVGAVAAFAASSLMKRSYEATTTLLITSGPLNASTSRNYDALLASQILVKTYGDLLNKRPLLETVITNLKLDTSAPSLANQVSVTSDANTQLIALTVVDSQAQRAADIANEIVNVFSTNIRTDQQERYAAAKHSLDDELVQSQADISRTQAALDALNAPAAGGQTNQDSAAAKQRLELLLSQYRNNYLDVLNSLATMRLTDPATVDGIRVVERASANPTPVRPRTLLNVLLAGLVSALLAVGAAFGIELFDDTVRSARDVKRLTDLPTLASIENIAGSDANASSAASLLSTPAVEAYRLLRMNIEISSDERPIHTIAVTSCGPREGNSTIVANLAAACAQTGKRVVLVDANLRDPVLQTVFGCPNERGLTTLLSSQDDGPVDQYLAATTLSNVKLLPSGPLTPNAADLIGLQNMQRLIDKLGAEADLVLFDTPPLKVGPDALAVARACNATLLVVRAGFVAPEVLIHAKNQLIGSGARVLGVVLNGEHMPSGWYDGPPGQLRSRLGQWRNTLLAHRIPRQHTPATAIEAQETPAPTGVLNGRD